MPAHVAIILDGNGRWAAQRGLSRIEGHRRGVDNARSIVSACALLGIRHLTLYAFSTENWRRPAAEVAGLFGIMSEVIDRAIDFGRKEGVRFRALGKIEALPVKLQESIKRAADATAGLERINVNVCINYGARDELVDVMKRLLAERSPPEAITEEFISRCLYTSGQPDPDLVIRTGGEQRLSNFLLWQSAYAELYFTDVLWPDFDGGELRHALESFSRRQRRFGALVDTAT